jgi:hypothetical protein
MTLAICHRLSDGTRTVVLDVLRERKPHFIPQEVVREFAELLKAYGCTEVWGDKYAGGFHSDEWRRNGITFKPSENDTSENYIRWLPLLLSGRAKLLDNKSLRSQTCALERSVMPSGHEKISHPRIANAHDDLCCAAAGCMVTADRKTVLFAPDSTWVSGPSETAAKTPQQIAREKEDEMYRWRRSNMFRSLGIYGI